MVEAEPTHGRLSIRIRHRMSVQRGGAERDAPGAPETKRGAERSTDSELHDSPAARGPRKVPVRQRAHPLRGHHLEAGPRRQGSLGVPGPPQPPHGGCRPEPGDPGPPRLSVPELILPAPLLAPTHETSAPPPAEVFVCLGPA